MVSAGDELRARRCSPTRRPPSFRLDRGIGIAIAPLSSLDAVDYLVGFGRIAGQR